MLCHSDKLRKYENVIGGEGKIVQKYTRKYPRGRFVKNERKQIWVFGEIEKDSNNCFKTVQKK